MPKYSKALVASTLLVAIVLGAAGYLLGRRHGTEWGVDALRRETAGVLALQVEALARLHVQEPDSAANLLDASVDAAIISLAGGPSFATLDPDIRQALDLAKVLRNRFPASGEQAERVHSILADIPTPARDSLSPGLRGLLEADPEDPFGGLSFSTLSQP